jgi:hypothetical protein
MIISHNDIVTAFQIDAENSELRGGIVSTNYILVIIVFDIK